MFDSTDMQMKHVLDPRVRTSQPTQPSNQAPTSHADHCRRPDHSAPQLPASLPRRASQPSCASSTSARVSSNDQVGISIARMLTRKYRDSVSDIFVLNANPILRISLFVVCPFLEKKVVEKIHVEVPGKHRDG